MAEKLNRVNTGIVASPLVRSGLCTQPTSPLGFFEEQRVKFLIPAIKGEKIAGFALAESTAGLDVASKKRGLARGGDHFVLNETKITTTNGPSVTWQPWVRALIVGSEVGGSSSFHWVSTSRGDFPEEGGPLWVKRLLRRY